RAEVEVGEARRTRAGGGAEGGRAHVIVDHDGRPRPAGDLPDEIQFAHIEVHRVVYAPRIDPPGDADADRRRGNLEGAHRRENRAHDAVLPALGGEPRVRTNASVSSEGDRLDARAADVDTETRRPDHPFTAPATRPPVMRPCTNRKKMTTGTQMRVEPAMTAP